jgi:hypothetical protein
MSNNNHELDDDKMEKAARQATPRSTRYVGAVLGVVMVIMMTGSAGVGIFNFSYKPCIVGGLVHHFSRSAIHRLQMEKDMNEIICKARIENEVGIARSKCEVRYWFIHD